MPPTAARLTGSAPTPTRPRRSSPAFYRDVKVVGAAEEGGDEAVRLALAVATQRVLARSLDLLGVEAPTEM